MKSAEAVADALGLSTPASSATCADINQEALSVALSLASDKAKDRYASKGRQLVFGADNLRQWDEGNWDTEIGLDYIYNQEANEVMVISDRLESDLTFNPPGMVYCDLLSPYRALEWVYATGIRKGYTS